MVDDLPKGGKLPKVSVILDEQQQVELKMIVSDRDEAAALQFLKEIVWAQVQGVRHKGLHSHLDKGADN